MELLVFFCLFIYTEKKLVKLQIKVWSLQRTKDNYLQESQIYYQGKLPLHQTRTATQISCAKNLYPSSREKVTWILVYESDTFWYDKYNISITY